MLVLADTSTPSPKFIVHEYSPEFTDSRAVDNVYSVKDTISVVADDIITVPSGPFHIVLTEYEIFTTELSSAVQVKVREDPNNTGLGKSERRLTVGLGTI